LNRRLDAGGNPDKFVVDAFHTCVVENQRVKGKTVKLTQFRDALLREASEAFPAEARLYKKLKGHAES